MGGLTGVGQQEKGPLGEGGVGKLGELTVPKTPTYPNYMKMIILKPLILLEC